MTLGEDLAAVLPGLQAQAESAMLSSCLVRRPTGITADPITGADVTTYAPEQVYPRPASQEDGRCRLRHRESQVLTQESSSSTVTIQRYELHVPISAGPFHVGDVAEVDGALFRVTGLHRGTLRTAQRLPVEEVS